MLGSFTHTQMDVQAHVNLPHASFPVLQNKKYTSRVRVRKPGFSELNNSEAVKEGFIFEVMFEGDMVEQHRPAQCNTQYDGILPCLRVLPLHKPCNEFLP